MERTLCFLACRLYMCMRVCCARVCVCVCVCARGLQSVVCGMWHAMCNVRCMSGVYVPWSVVCSLWSTVRSVWCAVCGNVECSVAWCCLVQCQRMRSSTVLFRGVWWSVMWYGVFVLLTLGWHLAAGKKAKYALMLVNRHAGMHGRMKEIEFA